MTRSLIGQTLDSPSEYHAHPPAADSWWDEADPLDSGTAHHVDSNLSRLSKESLRHWSTLTFELAVWTKYAGDGWDSLNDTVAPSADEIADDPARTISWDRRVAVRMGPYACVQDRDGGPGIYVPRTVRIVAQAYRASGAVTLKLYAALTTSPVPPSDARVAFATHTVATNGALERAEIDLSCVAPVAPALTVRARGASTAGARVVRVAPLYVWLGWQSSTTAGTARLYSADVFEVDS